MLDQKCDDDKDKLNADMVSASRSDCYLCEAAID